MSPRTFTSITSEFIIQIHEHKHVLVHVYIFVSLSERERERLASIWNGPKNPFNWTEKFHFSFRVRSIGCVMLFFCSDFWPPAHRQTDRHEHGHTTNTQHYFWSVCVSHSNSSSISFTKCLSLFVSPSVNQKLEKNRIHSQGKGGERERWESNTTFFLAICHSSHSILWV